jgi:choline dehydrogenase
LKSAYDYIVVGAGSAGCALAGRLSEDAGKSILLVEAGPTDWNPLIRLPVGEALTIGSSLDWKFRTEPEPGLDGRAVDAPRGKVLGGSSAINGQLYVRGHAGDFDEWAALGCKGWSYSDVLPSFMRAESWAGKMAQKRGSAGPVQTILGRYRNPLYEAFLQAGAEMGHRIVEDYNLGDNEGFCWAQFTQEHRRARRCSSAHAYLASARAGPNLTILTGARVVGLSMDALRCRGIRYTKHGKTAEAHAGEVILSAGAYQSPQILMLSGIGDADSLRQVGIRPIHHLPGVGNNLQDHCGGLIQHICKQPITYHALRNPFRLAAAAAQLYLTAGGPLSVFPMNTMAFLRSSADQNRPDLQFLFFPVAADIRGGSNRYAAFNGYAVTWGLMHPKSRGHVRLRSSDPLAPPLIRHNYLTDPHDVVLNNIGFRTAREIHAQKAFDPFRGTETDPGAEVTDIAAISAYNRRTLGSHFHPVGSCKMGTDRDAVVDPGLRVHGIAGLRVADASIMPTLTTGNTNAPSIMIGEKAAEIISRT